MTSIMVIIKEHNCGNCENCEVASARRFRCHALPFKPGADSWWDGFPDQHWCTIHWVEKVKAAPLKVEKPVTSK